MSRGHRASISCVLQAIARTSATGVKSPQSRACSRQCVPAPITCCCCSQHPGHILTCFDHRHTLGRFVVLGHKALHKHTDRIPSSQRPGGALAVLVESPELTTNRPRGAQLDTISTTKKVRVQEANIVRPELTHSS